MNDMITESMAIALLSKVLIDIWRYYMKSQPVEIAGWMYPVMAVMIGIAFSFLVGLANGIVITTQSVAQQIIVGILAAGQAVGITELQKRG